MTEEFSLPSPETGTTYRILIEAPEPKAEPGPWPVVLFMDGDDQFRFGVAAYRGLRAAGKIPPLLLAGVGYGASYTKPGNKRGRDYTPTKMAAEVAESGGADAFLAFLTTTLWTDLARRYPISQYNSGLAGHSLGSLLVLHALLQPKPFFPRYLASAPSIWWDDRALLAAALRLQRTGVALPAKLFLCVGADDTPSMTGDLKLFEKQLADFPFPQLETISRRFEERDHYNVLPDAFAAGFETLWGVGEKAK